jgi:hypothetical protein
MAELGKILYKKIKINKKHEKKVGKSETLS